jgi:hypothetical protein
MAQEPKKTDMVTIRLKHGRLLLGRDVVGKYPNGDPIYEEKYIEAGQTAEVPRAWAEKTAGRVLEGYPGEKANSVGVVPGLIKDSPIEILDRAAA